ncbi:MFS transporter [Brevundimonas sp.]|jgi:AAHS family 4-hydroxybenzoate transporter-like MFS transporter|uniref:MFS transporter n=1 Tax=Brevundimonas sp. TaxID=1871086 RepID=UPI0037BE9388
MSDATKSAVQIGPLLDDGPWSGFQKSVLVMVALAVVLDGFDNQVLGFAIPALIKEWGVSRAAFAPIFAIGFLGMAIGTALGGVLGDRLGRKPTLIGAVLMFGIATMISAFSPDVVMLGICRTIAGFGLGAAMPNATTLIAEFSPTRRRSAAITLGIVCIPLGGVIGGLIAAQVLPTLGWRALFLGGGVAPLLLAVGLWKFLPESPRFLAARLQRQAELVRTMARMGHVHPDAVYVDPQEPNAAKASVLRLFDRDFRIDTIALWVAFFFCILSTYIVFSWAPTLLASTGHDLSVSSTGLAAFNIGGVVGAVLGGFAILKFGSRVSMLVMAGGSVLGCLILTQTPLDGGQGGLRLMIELAVAGAFINGAQTTLYALAAQVYPTAIRATGVGATAAVGRLGAIVSSFIGAAVVAGGGATYFGAIAVTMGVVFLALALIRRHVKPIGAASAATVKA